MAIDYKVVGAVGAGVVALAGIGYWLFGGSNETNPLLSGDKKGRNIDFTSPRGKITYTIDEDAERALAEANFRQERKLGRRMSNGDYLDFLECMDTAPPVHNLRIDPTEAQDAANALRGSTPASGARHIMGY